MYNKDEQQERPGTQGQSSTNRSGDNQGSSGSGSSYNRDDDNRGRESSGSSGSSSNRDNDNQGRGSSGSSSSSSNRDNDNQGRGSSGSSSSSSNRGSGSSSFDDVNPAMVEKYLKGIHFPASKRDLANQAQQNDAPNEVTSLIDQMKDGEYKSVVEIAQEVGRIIT